MDNKEMYKKLMDIHTDVQVTKTKVEALEEHLPTVKHNKTFIDKLKGGLKVISTAGVIGLIGYFKSLFFDN